MTASKAESHSSMTPEQLAQLTRQIKDWGRQLGFDAVGVADLDLREHETHLQNWLAKGMHGEMEYMHKHGTKRTRPAELVSGTQRVISVRMDYAPADIRQAEAKLQETDVGYVSRYALGRDYHKVLRARLKQLAQKINQEIGEFGYRVFTDSAPVMEKALAEKAGLGWIGKHSNLLDSKTGSWFFLGELYIDLPLPIDDAATNHCGTCSRCIDLCPTGAIVGPYQVDARLCISYLTIELRDAIPVPLRSKLGNRIYGCDDCQFVCPWNKFARTTKEPDFTPRAAMTDQKLLALFAWSEDEFLKHTEGSAIRRIGHASWQRNIAVALGNARPVDTTERSAIISALKDRRPHVNDMVREHIDWALDQHQV